jgi:hypothetical protein
LGELELWETKEVICQASRHRVLPLNPGPGAPIVEFVTLETRGLPGTEVELSSKAAKMIGFFRRKGR